MKKQEIITLRNQGKTWKEISSRVGGHPNYLSTKFGKKAKRAKKLDLLGVQQITNSILKDPYEPKETTAKELIAAVRLVQLLGGTVIF